MGFCASLDDFSLLSYFFMHYTHLWIWVYVMAYIKHATHRARGQGHYSCSLDTICERYLRLYKYWACCNGFQHRYLFSTKQSKQNPFLRCILLKSASWGSCFRSILRLAFCWLVESSFTLNLHYTKVYSPNVAIWGDLGATHMTKSHNSLIDENMKK